MHDGSEVRLATTPEELEAIQRFRYEIVVEEQGKAFAGADPARRTLAEPIDARAAHFFTLDERGVSGTARLAVGTGLPAFAAQRVDGERFGRAFPAESVSTSSRIMVRRDARGHNLAGRLAAACYRHGLTHGGVLDFTFCEARILPLFLRLGYVPFGREVGIPVGDTLAPRIPLVLCLRDRAHLVRSGSVFAGVREQVALEQVAPSQGTLGELDDRGAARRRFLDTLLEAQDAEQAFPARARRSSR